MAPSRAVNAMEAMKALGIPPQKVKPVLKNLLQVYDNNWGLIEEENYRVLADAIFDFEDLKEEEAKKKCDEIDDGQAKKKEALVVGEPPLQKRKLQPRHDMDGSSSSPVVNSGVATGASSSKRAKLGDVASPQACPRQENLERLSPHIYDTENRTEISLPLAHVVEKRIQAVTPEREKRANCSLSPTIARGKTPVSSKTHFKEPKIEPGIDAAPQGDISMQRSFSPLIKPKDEPFMDDLPQFEVPIAVIHPSRSPVKGKVQTNPVSEGGCSSGNTSCGEKHMLDAHASEHAETEEDGGFIQKTGTSCQNGSGLELVNVPEASSAEFEIASSASGEVKISLSCTSALGRSDFHIPHLDTVLKLVEDRCLKSYKHIGPSLSVVEVLKELCQCFLEVGTDSTNDAQGNQVNVDPAFDFLKTFNVRNALGANVDPLQDNFSFPLGSTNGSANSGDSTELVSQVPRLFPSNGSDALEVCMGSDKINNKEINNRQGSEIPKSECLVVAEQRRCPDSKMPPHDANDIAKGEEKFKISLVSEGSNEQYPPFFRYIPCNLVHQSAYVNFSLARIGDEDCCSGCFGDCLSSSIPCACARETGGNYAYMSNGLIKEEFLDECISMNRDPVKHKHFYCKSCPLERSKNEASPEPCKGHLMRKFIKECWSKCGCNKQCGNRVVQRGISRKLQVFLTPDGKGWGLRTLEELPKGAFVCEYVGEILTNTELYERNTKFTGNKAHHYPVLLDADWGSVGVLKDEEALCLDATFYGNVARFINHRCFDASLVEVPVQVETTDHHYYHLAFFTTRKVEALDELTWDYGIDFDDHDQPVKAFRCHCGSKFCRDMKHSSRYEMHVDWNGTVQCLLTND